MTDWYAIRPEDVGRDERKVWITPDDASAPRGEWWLWKPRLTTGGEQAHPRLSDVAEMLTYRLAAEVGIPCAQCELATRHGVPGVISRSIAPADADLDHGSRFVASRADYSLPGLAEVLRDVGSPGDCSGMTAWQVFAGYLLLDAWVANTDRHGENWGILTTRSGPALAPAFDHGSALGSGLTDTNRQACDLDKFCRGGMTRHFAEGGSLLDLAHSALRMAEPTPWIDRVAAVPPTLWQGILGDIEDLSEVAATFVDAVLTRNQERVRSLCPR